MKKLCCNCGGKIAKRTISVHFGAGRDHREEFWWEVIARPKTKAEAQTYCNYPLVSVSYSRPNHDDPQCHVMSATFWDGHSFKDDYFCSFRCAAEYGYAAALQATKRAAE